MPVRSNCSARFRADNVFTISDKSLFALARDTLGFLRWCRAKDIDTVVDLELFSRFTALLGGSKRRRAARRLSSLSQ